MDVVGQIVIYSDKEMFVTKNRYNSRQQRQAIINSWTDVFRKQNRWFYYHILPSETRIFKELRDKPCIDK